MWICATRSAGYRVDVLHGVEAMVLRRHVNVIDVEQDAAVGGMGDLVEKLPLGHLRVMELGITADVFNGDRDSRKSCTSRIRAAVFRIASKVYGSGSRS